MFLEGLKSSVDVFFRAEEEPHPLCFLRSVSLQPGPEVLTVQVGQQGLLCGREGRAGLRVRPISGVAAFLDSPWL